MRIDFFHVDLLNKPLGVKGVSDVDTNCSTSSHYNYGSEATRTQKNTIEYTKDYSDIQNKLHPKASKDNSSTPEEEEFISEEYLLNLKKSIFDNEYKINIKALSMSLAKYIERN